MSERRDWGLPHVVERGPDRRVRDAEGTALMREGLGLALEALWRTPHDGVREGDRWHCPDDCLRCRLEHIQACAEACGFVDVGDPPAIPRPSAWRDLPPVAPDAVRRLDPRYDTCVEVPPEWEVTTYSPAPAAAAPVEEKEGSEEPNPLVGEKAPDSAGATLAERLAAIVAEAIETWGPTSNAPIFASRILYAVADDMHARGEHQVVAILRTEAER